jgi:hypothetical protein
MLYSVTEVCQFQHLSNVIAKSTYSSLPYTITNQVTGQSRASVETGCNNVSAGHAYHNSGGTY